MGRPQKLVVFKFSKLKRVENWLPSLDRYCYFSAIQVQEQNRTLNGLICWERSTDKQLLCKSSPIPKTSLTVVLEFVIIIITLFFCPLPLITHGSSEEDDSSYENVRMHLETPKVVILKDSHNCVFSRTGETCEISQLCDLLRKPCCSESSWWPCSCFPHSPHPSLKYSAPSLHPTPHNYINFSSSHCLFQE